MQTAVVIYLAMALGFCLLTYLVEAIWKAVPLGLILFLLVGKIIFYGLVLIFCAVWFVVSPTTCKAAFAKENERRRAMA